MMEKLQGLKAWVFWFFWLWLPEKRCAVITVISEATKQQVLTYLKCDPQKVRVIYCNVSNEFKPTPKVFNQSYPRILQVGTFHNKNIDRVIVALKGLTCKLVIIGHLSEVHKQALAQHCIDYESFENLPRDSLVEQYVLCDMLLFASTYEGFGLPIVEANAVGRPVITSNICSMPEVAGDAACMIDPFDAANIRAAVIRIINDPEYRDQLVANGLENVKRFQLKTIVEQYAALYRQVYAQSKQY
jgi:glycosyltransferase involved in cell wall biosynthesis